MNENYLWVTTNAFDKGIANAFIKAILEGKKVVCQEEGDKEDVIW